MDKMYNKIANLLVEVFPEGWNKAVMYAHITEDMYEIFFFVEKDNIYYNCFKLEKEFGISRRSIMVCFDKIHQALLNDYKEKKWYCATIQLSSDQKFVINYTYDDQSANEELFKADWKQKYLK